mmetsp:Transcript_5065/g.5750  ORF Transcript_5065/g.5750 Transcript_5065/m.5750 type:complete len:458 (-) Transcript_5065:605-1978(-)
MGECSRSDRCRTIKFLLVLGVIIFAYFCNQTFKELRLTPEDEIDNIEVQRKSYAAILGPDKDLQLKEDESEPKTILEHDITSYSHHNSATIAGTSMTKQIKSEEKSVQKNKSCVVWLHTKVFVEGLTAQKRTLEKLLELAKLLDARFVEPCIQNGKMVTCEHVQKNVRYSDLFDLNSLKRIYANIVPYEEFKKVEDYKQLCLGVEKGSRYCKKYEKTGTAKLVTFDQVASVINRRRRTGCKKDIVVLIPQMRKEMMPELRHGYPPEEFFSKYFVVKEKHYNFVKHSIFPVLGIKENSYSVIHWRAENVKTDLVTCARALVRAKKTMAKELPENHRFVLMTYLRRSDNFKFQWDNKRKDVHAQDIALNLLENNSFVSLDSAIQRFTQEIDDGSFIALWDLVLSQNARSFVTCTSYGVGNSCPGAEICKACNHLGSFARWAVYLRASQNKTSEECWPTS